MSSRNRAPEEVSINLTPMIDVVFLLVIFFMVGAKFSESDSKIDVTVSGAGNLQSIARTPDERVVEVNADGVITLDGAEVSREQLAATLATQLSNYPDLKVAVRAHSGGDLLQYFEVLNTVRDTGIERIGVAARVDSSGGSRW